MSTPEKPLITLDKSCMTRLPSPTRQLCQRQQCLWPTRHCIACHRFSLNLAMLTLPPPMRQLYLGHTSAATESAGPPSATTVALTAPLPTIPANVSWAAQCSTCVGTGVGVAAAPTDGAAAAAAHTALCAKCGFTTVRRPLAPAA